VSPVASGSAVHDLAVSNDWLVWSESSGQVVRGVATTGGAVVEYSTTGSFDFQHASIAVDATEVYWIEDTASGSSMRFLNRSRRDGSQKRALAEVWPVALCVTVSDIYYMSSTNVFTRMPKADPTAPVPLPLYQVAKFACHDSAVYFIGTEGCALGKGPGLYSLGSVGTSATFLVPLDPDLISNVRLFAASATGVALLVNNRISSSGSFYDVMHLPLDGRPPRPIGTGYLGFTSPLGFVGSAVAFLAYQSSGDSPLVSVTPP